MGHNLLNLFKLFILSGVAFLNFWGNPLLCHADNWEASIHENGAPQALVGVDKKKRTFNFFEKRSPLSLRYQYPCVTGQLPGDKYQINDLKTPEGIYFVEYKIASGLDFREYGGIAYTLNYPNPVDRLRGKTGYGIWIHSKGFGLAPTRGCVAIDLQDIAEIGPKLTPGLPVIVAEELKGISGFDNGVPAQLVSLMRGWTEAWENKSSLLFHYYDSDSYSKSTENFSIFRQNKERLFKILSFIKIYNREIHALEGPGYWVTWAEQLYTASNLSTEGVRRLYWQKDQNGDFRIVGMEWLPRNLGMAAEYKQGKLVAQNETQVASDASSEAPVLPRLDMPEQPVPVAEKTLAIPGPAPLPERDIEETRTSKTISSAVRTLAESLVAISEPLIPGKQIQQMPPDEIKWGIGKKLVESEAVKETQESTQEKASPASEEVIQVEEKANVANREANSANLPNEDSVQVNAIQKEEIVRKEIENLLTQWNKALQDRDMGIMDLYNTKLFNKSPAASIPRAISLNSLKQTFKQDFSWPGFIVIHRDPVIDYVGDFVKTSQEILFVTRHGQKQGTQNLWWARNADGEYRIVGSQFLPGVTGLEANYLEMVSNDIARIIEAWRKAWETAQIDEYMSFYTPDAVQSGRTGAANIRFQKSGLWSRVKPVLVNLSGLRLSIEPAGIRADMNQTFADSAGRSDKGIKTLLLSYDGSKWRIKKEDWSAVPPKQE